MGKIWKNEETSAINEDFDGKIMGNMGYSTINGGFSWIISWKINKTHPMINGGSSSKSCWRIGNIGGSGVVSGMFSGIQCKWDLLYCITYSDTAQNQKYRIGMDGGLECNLSPIWGHKSANRAVFAKIVESVTLLFTLRKSKMASGTMEIA